MAYDYDKLSVARRRLAAAAFGARTRTGDGHQFWPFGPFGGNRNYAMDAAKAEDAEAKCNSQALQMAILEVLKIRSILNEWCFRRICPRTWKGRNGEFRWRLNAHLAASQSTWSVVTVSLCQKRRHFWAQSLKNWGNYSSIEIILNVTNPHQFFGVQICSAAEFTFVVRAVLYCQAGGTGGSCYAFTAAVDSVGRLFPSE